MSNIYEQRFFSALKDTFIGHPIKGKSGYVNLMDLKAQYFAEIEPYIKKEIDKQIEAKYREELFEKLFNFFDCYLNETGTVFFANSQIHKNLYEKVYSDRDDVALFWKTQKLYYVKSEANYDDLQTEVNGINIKFDASEIKHAKGNEKKSIQFFMVKATKDEVVFKIRYQENNKYDRLKTYLDLDKNNDIIDKCIDEYGSDLHPNIVFENTGIDQTVFDKKGDQRKCLYIENLDDALESVKVEYSINDLSLMLQYLHKNGIILYEEDLKKIFSIYKRQNEIDYFIHKDAEGFLKEQFDIYVYNWLFNDLDTDFDAATVKRMQNIKKIAHKVIEYIARFEDELKAIWEKPKFVRNCNYVLTLDRLAEHIDIIEKLLKSPGWKKQVEEWQSLNKEWTDEDGNVTKKKWKEFDFVNEKGFEKEIIQNRKISIKFQNLPIDTRFFPELKYQILNCFEDIDKLIDGSVVHSDNFQAVKAINVKFSDNFDVCYIDPPFNTGSDFYYKDKFQDSTWLTLMENRLNYLSDVLNKKGSFFLHLDHNAIHYGRILLDNTFSKTNYQNEIIWHKGREGGGLTNLPTEYNSILVYKTGTNRFWKPPRKPYKLSTVKNIEKDNKGWYYTRGRMGRTPAEWEIEQGSGLKTYVHKDTSLTKEKVIKILTTESNENSASIGDVWNKEVLGKGSRVTNYDTEKPESLLKLLLQSSCPENGSVIDIFGGSGSTAAASHKLGFKWFTADVDFGTVYNFIVPRFKKILCGCEHGISKEVEFKGGGFFKYYELEQYEDVLAKSQYQWQGKKSENQIEQYSFLQDQKLLDALVIDYEKKNAKVVFENLYPDVDIAETLSNLSGKHIKQLFEDKVVFEDGSEVIYDEMTFEKYPWIKPLIWWNSK